MTSRVLDREQIHWGFPCAEGTAIDTFERSGTLARRVDYRGVSLPASSTFFFDCDFHHLSVVVADATSVHGVDVARGSRLEFPPFPAPLACVGFVWLLPLYPFPLWQSWSARRRGEVTLTPSDALTVSELEIHPGDRLTLDRHGVRAWLLSSPRSCHGLELRTGHITFDAMGAVREVMLYRSQIIHGFPCFGSGLAGTELRFDELGALRRFVLSESSVVGGRTLPRGTRVILGPDGSLEGTKHLDVDVMLYTCRPEVHEIARGNAPE